MTELLTAAQMRAIEQAAIDSGEVTGLELMERAGRGVVDAIFEEWPALRATSHRAVVLCGPGNNGGDGFVVARLLKEWGWEVEVFLYGDAAKLPPDARVNYERWGELGDVDDLETVCDSLGEYAYHPLEYVTQQADLVVDALFGIGLSRQLRLQIERAIPDLKPELKIVAVDIPSGLCADTGTVLGRAVFDGHKRCFQAALTVTFHRAKHGHFVRSDADHTGKLVIKDIGLEPWHWSKRQT